MDLYLSQALDNLCFEAYALLSGQILCSEPDGPPVELQVGPHDWSKELPEANTTCPKCRAVV